MNQKSETIGHSEIEPPKDDRLRELLADLIASSKALDARVWLDGVYTEIANEQAIGSWMEDRDIYFKVEGRIDKKSAPQNV